MGWNKKMDRSQGSPGTMIPSQEKRQAIADISLNMVYVSPQHCTVQQPLSPYTPGCGQNCNRQQNMQHS